MQKVACWRFLLVGICGHKLELLNHNNTSTDHEIFAEIWYDSALWVCGDG